MKHTLKSYSLFFGNSYSLRKRGMPVELMLTELERWLSVVRADLLLDWINTPFSHFSDLFHLNFKFIEFNSIPLILVIPLLIAIVVKLVSIFIQPLFWPLNDYLNRGS